MSSEKAAQAIVGDIDDAWAKTYKVGELRRKIIDALDVTRTEGYWEGFDRAAHEASTACEVFRQRKATP